MKQVKPSKIMIERSETVVKAISGENEFTQDNANALAYVLELPSKNTVDGEEYGNTLAHVVNAINDNVAIDLDTLYSHITKKVVVKTTRVLSPKVRQERYEKAKAKLLAKYGISEG